MHLWNTGSANWEKPGPKAWKVINNQFFRTMKRSAIYDNEKRSTAIEEKLYTYSINFLWRKKALEDNL